MAVSRTAGAGAGAGAARAKRPAQPSRSKAADAPILVDQLSQYLGYSLKRAQLRIFDNFIRCVAPLDLTPAHFSVLLLLEGNPGRNQTEISRTLGILKPNFVAMLDELESRDLCIRVRSNNDRRSHILVLTEEGAVVLARAKKLIGAKHEARLGALLGENNRVLLLGMLEKIAREF